MAPRSTMHLQRKSDGTYRLGPESALLRYPDVAADLKVRRDELIACIEELLAAGLAGCECADPVQNCRICPHCDQTVYVIATPDDSLTAPEWAERLGRVEERSGAVRRNLLRRRIALPLRVLECASLDNTPRAYGVFAFLGVNPAGCRPSVEASAQLGNAPRGAYDVTGGARRHERLVGQEKSRGEPAIQ